MCIRGNSESLAIGGLWQRGHLGNGTNGACQGRHIQATLEIKVAMITLRLLLDTAWLFRIVSCVNEDTLLLMYLIPVGTGQFKDTNESYENGLKLPCDNHCLA